MSQNSSDYQVDKSTKLARRCATKVLARLFERSTQAVLVFSLTTGKIELANHLACISLGYSRDGLMTLSISDVCLGLLPEKVKEICEKLERGIPYHELETSFRRRVGTRYPVQVRLELIETEVEPLVAVYADDLSENANNARQLEIAVNTGKHCFSSMNLDTWEIQRDPALDKIYGFPDFDPARTAHAFFECITPEYQDAVGQKFVELSLGRIEQIDHCFPITTLDGKTRWIHGVGRLSEYDPRMVVGMQTDITEQRERRQRAKENEEQLTQVRGALAHSEKELSDLLASLPDVVTRASPDTVLKFANTRYCEFLGLPQSEVIGKSFFNFIPDNGKKITRDALESLTPESPMASVEQPMGDPDDDQWYMWSNLMIYDADANPTEIISVGRDISELVRARREVDENNNILARKNEALEKFSGTVAYDLKLPVRNIALFANLIEDDIAKGRAERAVKNARQIGQISDSITGLIDGLLEYSQIAYQDIEVELVDLAEVIGDAKRVLWKAISDAGAKIDVGEMPVIKGNHKLLVHMFQHLFANSIKFRKLDTKPELSISSRSSASEVRVEFSDNGIGIDPKYKDWVFGIFQKLHHDEKTSTGTGIGLTLAQQIAGKHEGTLELDPDYSDGARFVIILPRGKKDMKNV